MCFRVATSRPTGQTLRKCTGKHPCFPVMRFHDLSPGISQHADNAPKRGPE